MRLDDKEWWVVAGVFTFHVLLAMIMLVTWFALGVMIFYAIAWVVAML